MSGSSNLNCILLVLNASIFESTLCVCACEEVLGRIYTYNLGLPFSGSLSEIVLHFLEAVVSLGPVVQSFRLKR